MNYEGCSSLKQRQHELVRVVVSLLIFLHQHGARRKGEISTKYVCHALLFLFFFLNIYNIFYNFLSAEQDTMGVGVYLFMVGWFAVVFLFVCFLRKFDFPAFCLSCLVIPITIFSPKSFSSSVLFFC